MRPDQIELLTTVSALDLHPDGSYAVASLQRPDVASNAYRGQLWRVPLDGGDPTRLTSGFRDGRPRFSPDGTLLAFLRSTGAGEAPQLAVVAADAGEPIVLTDAPLGVLDFAWAPDGRRIAHTARVPEPGRYGTDPDIPAGAEAPRLITDLRYLQDGVGYAGDRPVQIFTIDVPDVRTAAPTDRPDPVAITDGPEDSTSVAWSPDGTRLAFVSARHASRTEDLRTDAWVCNADGSEPVAITSGLSVDSLAWSADGSNLWLLAGDPGPDALDFIARHVGLWTVPADGSGAPERVTEPEWIDLGEVGSHLTVVGEDVYVQNRTRGTVELLRVRAGAPEVVIGGAQLVTSHAVAGRGDDAVVIAAVRAPDSPGEIVRAGTDGSAARLTDFGAELRARAGVYPLHERTVTAGDGYQVHGWVVLPEGPGPHPVLLDIHGGPFTQYGWEVYDEAQVLAGAGYAVVLANPRGSAGYGQEHGRCVTGQLGDRDAEDLLDFLDAVLADPDFELAPDRVGVLGGSYGGYMTAWLTSYPRSADRFAAAIVERGFLDPISFAGTSDIGWFFGDLLVGTDPEQVRRQSPMAALDRVHTPTLVIHSEQDYRCPLEQGQRYFHGLVKRSVPAELLIFPGESHGLTRDGQPRHRVQRFEHVLRWWAQHLPVKTGTALGDDAG